MIPKQILTTLVKVAFLGLLIYFCLQFFIPRWQSLQLSDRLGGLSGLWIFAVMMLTVTYYGLGLLIWANILRILGSRPDPHHTAGAYVYSLLAKYIPGSVAAHGVRTQLAMSAGVPVGVLMKSFLLEAVLALATAAAIAIPGTIYFAPAVMDGLPIGAGAIAVVALVAIVGAWRLRLADSNAFRFGATAKGYVGVGCLYLLIWFASAAAHWCLANALNDYSIAYFPLLMVAVSASWVIGFVSVFAPAGLGVREAVLYFFVSNSMDHADVILFVTLSRLVMFGVEVFLTLGFLVYSKVAQRAATAMTR